MTDTNTTNTTETVKNVTVLPPVLEPKKRKPITEAQKAERAAKKAAFEAEAKKKTQELRKEVSKELLDAMSIEERSESTNGYSDAFFAFQNRVSEEVTKRVEEWKKSQRKSSKKGEKKPFNVEEYLKKRLSEVVYDLMHTTFKSKKTGEIRTLEFHIDQWKNAAEHAFFNPVRRQKRNRKSNKQ